MMASEVGDSDSEIRIFPMKPGHRARKLRDKTAGEQIISEQ